MLYALHISLFNPHPKQIYDMDITIIPLNRWEKQGKEDKCLWQGNVCPKVKPGKNLDQEWIGTISNPPGGTAKAENSN